MGLDKKSICRVHLPLRPPDNPPVPRREQERTGRRWEGVGGEKGEGEMMGRMGRRWKGDGKEGGEDGRGRLEERGDGGKEGGEDGKEGEMGWTEEIRRMGRRGESGT